MWQLTLNQWIMQKSGNNQKPILTPGYIQGGSPMSVWFPQVNDAESTVAVEFTPTIPHCSMATLIGLSIKVKLIRSLPERFKVSNQIAPKAKKRDCIWKLQRKKKKALPTSRWKLTGVVLLLRVRGALWKQRGPCAEMWMQGRGSVTVVSGRVGSRGQWPAVLCSTGGGEAAALSQRGLSRWECTTVCEFSLYSAPCSNCHWQEYSFCPLFVTVLFLSSNSLNLSFQCAADFVLFFFLLSWMFT